MAYPIDIVNRDEGWIHSILTSIREKDLLNTRGMGKERGIPLEAKSWNCWLKEGERNTTLFHCPVLQNRMQNKIYSLKTLGGERVESREEIEATLNNFFTEIMSDPRPERSADIDQITRFIPPLVSVEKIDLLMNPITLYEVEEAVFQMKEGTTPGPDGFAVNFFHGIS